MGTESGHLASPTVLLTREVRWFNDGPLPAWALDWFTTSVSCETEHRLDRYDLAAARNGVGRKERGATILDVKFRVEVMEAVSFGQGLTGRIEDWLKISEPLGNGPVSRISDTLEVEKRLYTRRFLLDAGRRAGCEVELVAIKIGALQAWSLCFETLGSPEHRVDALQSGIEQLIAASPLPTGMELGHGSCLGYPQWIASRVLESA